MRDALDRNWEERTVTVDRARLLETLKFNREKHIKEYNEAVAGYKQQAKEQLASLRVKILKSVDENFGLITNKIDAFDPTEESLSDHITLVGTTSFTLQVPKSYEKSYSVAIQMAEWEVAETIQLKQSQFQCFVLDDWDWKTGFEKLSKSYLVK
jgi:hypothetical protein